MRVKRTAIAGAAVAALMLTAACGGGGGSADEKTGKFAEGGNAGSGKNADAKGPLAIPADAQKGGTITVETQNAPSTLDPTRTYYVDSGAIMSLVTRSLTQYVYDPKTKDMVLEPDLATDLGHASADGKTWTFTLKDGIKYEDGTAVKAEDVAYSIKRSFAIDTLPDGPTYQTTFFVDGDKYKGPFAKTDADLKKLTGYKAGNGWYGGDDYKGVEASGNKITIHLAKPFPELDYYASFPVFSPIPEAKDANPLNYEQHPVATGPYKFESYKPGAELKLVKNDQWDPNTDPGRIQAADGWDFRFSQDTAKIEQTILGDQGEAQTTLSYDNVTPATFKEIQSSKPDNLVQGTSPCTIMLSPDNTKIKDIKVREAIGWAFPYTAYLKAIGEIPGVTTSPATSILPPGTAGRVDYQFPEGQNGQTTDPAKAKALLKEAGAEGFELKWYYSRDDAEKVAGKDQMVKAFEAAGFKATPIAATSDTIRDLTSKNGSPDNFTTGGWCSDWPSGGSWFPARWAGSLAGVEGKPNPTQFKQADADKKQDDILSMTPDKVPGAWGEFDKWMQETYYPQVPLYYSDVAMIHGSKVGGEGNDSTKGMPTFNTMYLKK